MIEVLDETLVAAERSDTVQMLAADIGGTHARVGIASARRGDAASVRIAVSRKYVCADYPDLAAILGDFLRSAGAIGIREGAIACAGVQVDGVVVNTNLPWRVSVEEVRNRLGLSRLALVNDFEAVAHAIPSIGADSVVQLNGLQAGIANAPTLVAGPGTGFGAAIRVPTSASEVVLATEAGQARFTPSTELEIEILRLMRRDHSYVPTEYLLSGPGLVNLYRSLAMLSGESCSLREPAAISEAALQETDALALQSLNVFCGLMGAIVGDLVLLYRSLAGVYLAGGILSQIRTFLQRSPFQSRFLDKGAMSDVLKRVPVRLVDHGQLGVIGAASWYVGGPARNGR